MKKIRTKFYTMDKMKPIKKILIVLVICCSIHSAYAQTIKELKPNDPLPLDPMVKYGKLPNGFTYYIRHAETEKNKVHFTLSVNAGGYLEDRDQWELAHFLEHMAFVKTTHFPNGFKSYIDAQGLKFANDVNANANNLCTNYWLSFPTDKEGLVQSGLNWLRDVAQGGILFEPDLIDNQRGVVLGEIRSNRSIAQDIKNTYIKKVYGASKYTDRAYADSRENVKTFQHPSLIRFYMDWYRPDLEAIIVVGDINVNEMEQQIKALFSDLTLPANPRSPLEKPAPVSLNGKNQLIVVTHEQKEETELKLILKQPKAKLVSSNDFRASLVNQLCVEMINSRFNILKEELAASFTTVVFQSKLEYGNHGNPFGALMMEMKMKKGIAFKEGFTTVMQEFERIKRYGFTQKELAKVKEQQLRLIEQGVVLNANMVANYQDHYLTGSAMPGEAYKNEMDQQLIAEISLTDVNTVGKNWAADKNRDIVILAPEKEKSDLPDEMLIDTWMAETGQAKLNPFVFQDEDELLLKPMMSKLQLAKLPAPKLKAIKQKEIKEIGVTEWILPNGIKILLKPMKAENGKPGEINIKGIKAGGLDQYKDDAYVQAYFACALVGKSGLGNYDTKYWERYKKKKELLVVPYMTETDIQIDGSVKESENFETVLQAMYLYFTQPNKDGTVLKQLITERKKANAEEVAKNRPLDIYFRTIREANGTTNRTNMLSISEELDKADINQIFRIYQENFKHAADFTFVITGDFEPAQVKPLLAKYLGALAPGDSMKNSLVVNDGSYQPKVKVNKIVYSDSKEDKARCQLSFIGQYAYNKENKIKIDVLGKIFGILVHKRLREKEGLVYTPSGSGVFSKDFGGLFSFNMNADGCATANVDKVFLAVWDELNQIKAKGPDAAHLQNAKAMVKVMIDDNLKHSYIWTDYLIEQTQKGEDYKEILQYPAILESITPQMIQEMAQQFFTEENSMRFVLMPKAFAKSINE